MRWIGECPAVTDLADTAQLLEVFATDGLKKREQHGSREAQVFAPEGRTDTVLVLLQFDSADDFDAFRTDPEAPPIIRRGTAQRPPRFTVLHPLAQYDH